MKIVDGLKMYLTDWKNLLTHGIVGVILLYCLLFAPVAWYWRVILLIIVIAFHEVILDLKQYKVSVVFPDCSVTHEGK